MVANVAIGAARLTINADLSATSTVKLGISSDYNEDASFQTWVVFFFLSAKVDWEDVLCLCRENEEQPVCKMC